jgi:hypothetical protein
MARGPRSTTGSPQHRDHRRLPHEHLHESLAEDCWTSISFLPLYAGMEWRNGVVHTGKEVGFGWEISTGVSDGELFSTVLCI